MHTSVEGRMRIRHRALLASLVMVLSSSPAFACDELLKVLNEAQQVIQFNDKTSITEQVCERLSTIDQTDYAKLRNAGANYHFFKGGGLNGADPGGPGGGEEHKFDGKYSAEEWNRFSAFRDAARNTFKQRFDE